MVRLWRLCKVKCLWSRKGLKIVAFPMRDLKFSLSLLMWSLSVGIEN